MISDQELLEVLAGALRNGRGVAVPVSGSSMGPDFASVRDIVVEPFAPSAIRLGSIIAFQRNGRWIVHRVMWKFRRTADPFCITKGDRLRALDRPFVKASEIKGIVVGLVTNDGDTISLTSTPRRLAGRCLVMRGWLTVGLWSLLAFRPLSR